MYNGNVNCHRAIFKDVVTEVFSEVHVQVNQFAVVFRQMAAVTRRVGSRSSCNYN